jgi:hypothetical protein
MRSDFLLTLILDKNTSVNYYNEISQARDAVESVKALAPANFLMLGIV